MDTLGKLAQNLERTSSKVRTHLYASDPEDCLIFDYEFTTQVEKHHVNRSGSAVHRRRLSYRFKARALRIMSRAYKRGSRKRHDSDVDEEELEEEQDPRVRTTSSGRILKLPNRFY